ncbi:hypothetical protein DICPUDRAFT_159288 [Dictyostelium purpureum]|uniref:Uncharacterized protein n=1 Tax=Dictyostelium purpureum TaxID=5786 RepID=F1A3R4_DICPU|nr:uncharacterized protein DICPUDRAFT_159288 [Dictyostelium purpureum]EGC29165.1 hypothetical protein DICPUDRAFT_159288 [Dictyostelium purpureum]|eukprot:XP_003294309.1 hypothetical protein DICPUDRAFT_159288 [Dictyostelium purpureum]
MNNNLQFFTHYPVSRHDIEILTWICKVILSTRMFNCVVKTDSFFYRVFCTVALAISSSTLSSIFLNQLPKYMTKSHEYLLPLIISLSILMNFIVRVARNINRMHPNQLFREDGLIIKIVCSLCCVICGMDDVFSIYIKPLHRAQETMVGCFVMGFLSVSLGTIISSIIRKNSTGAPNILEKPSLDFIVINIMVASYYFLKEYGSQTITLSSGFYSRNYFVDEILLFSFTAIYSLIFFLNIVNSSKGTVKYNNNNHSNTKKLN